MVPAKAVPAEPGEGPLVTGPVEAGGPTLGPRPTLDQEPAERGRIETHDRATIAADTTAEHPTAVERPSGPRQVAASRPPDFEANLGVPGHLYLARNPLHRAELFKIGQTRHRAQQRVRTLNEELEQVRDIGRFRLEHSAPVSDAFGAEQAVFALLAECRVAPPKEFFLGNIDMLREAIDCVASGGAAAAFRARWDEQLSAAVERRRQVRGPPWQHPPGLTGNATGWVVVLRDDWHADDIYRIGHTRRDPLETVRRLNRQRQASATVGFFRPVLTVPVRDAPNTARAVLSRLGAHRVDARLHVVQGLPLADLERAIGACALVETTPEQRSRMPGSARTRTSRQAPAAPLVAGEQSDNTIDVAMEGPRRRFTCPYGRCQATLSAYGSPNTTGSLVCHRCRRVVDFEIDESGRAVPSKEVLDWDRERASADRSRRSRES